MGFLAPWFLTGLLAVGLPLWLHLLRRSQHTPKPFSSLMFFERRIESSSKHRKLRYLALLAARVALLAAIVFAFAGPFINRSSTAVRKRRVAVVAVDRSFSMRGGTRMADARTAAHSAVNSVPGNQPVQVLAFDRGVEAMSAPELGRGTANAAIDAIQPGDLESSYGELVRALRVMAQSHDTELDIHLVSDLQQSSMPPDFRDLSLSDGATLQIHGVGSAASNWAVESVATAPRVYDVKRTLLTATVTGWQTPASTQRAELIVDGKTAASKELQVPANGHAEVEFRGFNVPFGQHRGEVRIAAADGLNPDNRFYFSVERSDPRPVLFLYAHGRSKQAFYYRSAFQSASDSGLEVETLPIEQLEGKDLARYAFIVLNDIGNLDKAAEQKICAFVTGGKAALVATGPDTFAAGRIPLSRIIISTQKKSQGAGAVETQHGAVAGSGRFDNVEFFQTGKWTPAEKDHIIARLADDTPLLVEQPSGEGRVLQFAATLDSTSSDFPLHAVFVPFVAQTGRYLAGGEAAAASYTAGSALPLRRGRGKVGTADVIGPDGRHELSLAQAKGSSVFELTREGFYEIVSADGRRTLAAAHADRRESDGRTISAETLALWRNTGGRASAADRTEAGAAETRRWSFWRYVLIVAVLAALVESALARRHAVEGQRAI